MEINTTPQSTFALQAGYSASRLSLSKLSSAPAAGTDGWTATPLAEISSAQGWSDVSFQQNSASYTYRKNGSLALQVQSSLDFSMHTQQTDIQITFSADLFGQNFFGPDAFKNGPIKFHFESWDNSVQVESTTQVNLIKPTRKAEDILQDISSALQEVLSQKDDKNVRLVLDGEAIGVLLADPKIGRLLDELVGLISVINSLSFYHTQRNSYTILVSGKGDPYLDVDQKTSIKANAQKFNFDIVINPPQSAQNSLPAQTDLNSTESEPT